MQVRPFLMFEGQAEQALRLYVSLFPDAEILELAHHPDGKVAKGLFRLGDQVVQVFDSPTPHGFTFTPSFSFMVECDSLEQLERLYAALRHQEMMPLDNYGFSQRFAWVSDPYGVSWQLNLP